MSRSLALSLLSMVLAAPLLAVPASQAGPTVGFVEEWPGTSVSSWGGGAQLSNPGTGGFLGSGDGYLLVSTIVAATDSERVGKLGASSLGNEYVGNWLAAGVNQVRVRLDDVGVDDALEIHFSLGEVNVNFWQYNVGFQPPEHQWGEFIVDLSSSANWTQIVGAGTFNGALQNVDRVLWRHDRAPYVQIPDSIRADVGIDHMVLANGAVAVGPRPAAVGLPVELDPPSPNPSGGAVALTLHSHDGEAVRLDIVDVGGRSVRTARLPGGGTSPRLWVWDGRDDSGLRVPPGAYRVRAAGPGGGTSRALVRLR